MHYEDPHVLQRTQFPWQQVASELGHFLATYFGPASRKIVASGGHCGPTVPALVTDASLGA